MPPDPEDLRRAVTIGDAAEVERVLRRGPLDLSILYREGSLALFPGFFWFVSVPRDADDRRGVPKGSDHRVASTEELEPILERGYAVEVWGGPYRLRAE